MINITAAPASFSSASAIPAIFSMSLAARKTFGVPPSSGQTIGRGESLQRLVTPQPKTSLQTLGVLASIVFFGFSVTATGVPALQPLCGLPLFFEPSGEAPGGPFLARGINYQFLIKPTEVQIALCKRE